MLFGGVISVALSLGSPRVGVTDFPVLWSPDFPPAHDACAPAIFRPPSANPVIVADHGSGSWHALVPRGDFTRTLETS